MYYEYQYEFSALLVLSLAVVCLFYKPSIYKKYGRSVSNAIFLCYIFSLTDAFTAMLFNTHNPKYYSLSYLLMSIYFLSAIWLPYFLGKFIFEICEAKFNNIFYAIPNIVLSVILLGFNNFTHLFFDIDKSNLEYVSGVFFLAIDLMFVLLYIGVGLNAKSNYVFLGKVRVRTLIGLMVFDITVILYQFINRYILVTGLAIAINIVILIIIFYFVDVIFDEVTGLKNKEGFKRSCSEYIKKARSVDGYYIFKLEIYNLKVINEKYGYEESNEIINFLSKRIETSLKDFTNDYIIGRIGGDDFAIMAPYDGVSHPDMVCNLQTVMGSDDPKYDYVAYLYAGACEIKDKKSDVTTILDNADYALGYIRGKYNNHIAVYEGRIQEDDKNTKEIEQRERQAIENDEFALYLQPIYDTKTQRVVSAEALVRWIPEDGKIISPGAFIPIFEKNGFITKLDLLIFSKVCRNLRKWLDEGLNVVPVSVNFSRIDMMSNNIIMDIMSIINAHRIPHELIKIEITESAFNDNDDRTIEIMKTLHDEGFKIMMDDFGSGYSNLNMFREMPIDIVKIDMVFLKNIEISDNGKIVVKSVVEMTKKLGLPVVVEGVETDEQYDFINNIDCEMTQGYLFSKPIPAGDFEKNILRG